MTEQQRADRMYRQYPERHRSFVARPHLSRRGFFELAGAGLTCSFLAPMLRAQQAATQSNVTTINTAKNVIFILLTGAISHTDSFDLKVVNGVTPSDFQAGTANGITWPVGLLPNMSQQLPDMAIIRSMSAHALVHTLAQRWAQIGRNPAAVLGNVAPNIGSVVAREKGAAGSVFPAFLALNSNACAGAGYFAAQYAPFKVTPSTAGLPNTTNPNDPTGASGGRFAQMYQGLHALDDPLRIDSPYGKPLDDYEAFYEQAKLMMYNPVVKSAFSFAATDSTRYGSSGFGNACLVAKQVLEANQGTRFVQISFGSWDFHQDIYGQTNPKGPNMYTLGKQLDAGYAALVGDLKSSGLLDSTLVVMVGEFGRTVGPLTAAGGRDHWPQQSAVFAGAGIKGGKVIGSTTADGSATQDPGWSRNRSVNVEDIEATIYSAMGINWTTVSYDDPFGRGFEYVPFSDQNLYGPVNELWS
ncbi:MAG: DUF1501 domain-containing protein [Acidobacteriota bacterium]|nr:DUF1501 domain-containing protein [Acidobacteriota bacterium]